MPTPQPHQHQHRHRARVRRWRWRWRLASDTGSAPLELAIIAPALMLLVFGALQACLIFHARSIALAAAQQGADAARAYDAPTGAGPQQAQAFLDRAAGDNLTTTTITVTSTTTTVAVTVQGDAISLLPGLDLHVRQTSTGPRERVTP